MLVRQNSQHCFDGVDLVPYLDLDVGIEGKEKVDAGTELDDAALVSAVFHVAGFGIADDPPGEGAGDLLEEDLPVGILQAGGGMLVEFGRLRVEGKQIAAGMVLVVGHLAVDGPEVAMDIEKVHIDGYLDTIALEIFLFEDFLHDDHLPVGDRSDQPVILCIRGRPVRDAEEISDKHHEDHEDGRQGYGNPKVVDEMGRQPDQNGTDNPTAQDGSIRVIIDFNPVHIREVQ